MRQADPFIVRLCRGIYALSLRAYPKSFRANFEEEMRQVFADSCRQAMESGGWIGVAKLMTLTTCDLGITAMKEHATTHGFGVLLLATAIAGAICFIGWVDQHNDEPQPAALCIIVCSFVLSTFFPRRPWLWAILIGASIPFAGGFMLLRGKGDLHGFLTCPVAFIPAFIGAYAGWLVRKGAFAGLNTR